MTPEITLAGPDDRARIVGTLVAAFAEDPVLRFLFPAAEDYPVHAAAFFGHLYDKRVGRQCIWTIGGGASVAMWEPPSGGDTPAREIDLPADARERMKEYDEALRSGFPDGPFWYLGVLGTDPAYAGRGWGRMVMAAGLRRVAEDGLPAVLETSKPANVELYRRAGWRVFRQVDGPLPIWVMTR